jgi:hypothetical protein
MFNVGYGGSLMIRILLGLMLLATPVWAEVLGNNVVGGSTGAIVSQFTRGRIYTLPEDAVAINGYARLHSFDNSKVLTSIGIYETENGYPTQLIAESRFKYITNSTFEWVEFSFCQLPPLKAGDYFIAYHTYDDDPNEKVRISFKDIPLDVLSWQSIDSNIHMSNPYPEGAGNWKTSPFNTVDPNIYIVYEPKVLD